MVRALRGKRAPNVKKEEQYDNDAPETYKDMPVPDKRSSQYTKDKIDEFHDAKISKLLASGVQMDSDHEDGDEERENLSKRWRQRMKKLRIFRDDWLPILARRTIIFSRVCCREWCGEGEDC